MRPASPQRSGSSPKCSAYARIAASTASMCFRSDSLAVYSCINARVVEREGREAAPPECVIAFSGMYSNRSTISAAESCCSMVGDCKQDDAREQHYRGEYLTHAEISDDQSQLRVRLPREFQKEAQHRVPDEKRRGEQSIPIP